MRVGVNARLLHASDLRGWNRYTVNLLTELPARGAELVLYTDRPLHPAHLSRLPAGSFTIRVGSARPYEVWEQGWLPWRAGRDRVDLLHAPANFGLPWSCPCPRVLTLHDAIDPLYYWARAPVRQRWQPDAARSRLAHWSARTCAERVITVSTHARRDLVEALGLDPARVRVVPEAADPGFLTPIEPGQLDTVRARHGLERPYAFYVGGWEGRKNISFLVRGFAEASLDGIDLVLAGGRAPQRGELAALAGRLGMGDRLRLLGWVDDEDLPALYAGSLAFVYPSEYEGFGLQLCEAMAVGCPVLAARATCLPEVLGTGGETFALDDPSELAGLLRRVAHEPAFRDDLAVRSRARSRAFSWARAAEATVAVYRELLGRPDHAPDLEPESPCAFAARS